MSRDLQLRRLLSRRKIAAWLADFPALAQDVSLAIIDLEGRVFARSGEWPDQARASSIARRLSVPPEAPGLVDDLFVHPLAINDVLLGFLLANSPDVTAAGATGRLVGQALDMLIDETYEKRALASETLDRYREINLLYRIGESIAATLDPKVVSQLLLEESRKITDADFGVLYLLKGDGWRPEVQLGRPVAEADLAVLVDHVQKAVEPNKRPEIITISPHLPLSETGLEVGALLWGPLVVAEEPLGGVLLGRLAEKPIFVANDQKLLAALTSQAASALENAYLFEESNTTAQHLQQMNAIGRELSAMLDVDQILAQIIRAATELANAQMGGLLLVEEPDGALVFRVVEGGPPELVGQRLEAGQGIAGRVAARGRPEIVNLAQGDGDWYGGIDDVSGVQTRSVLAAPLLKGDQVVGVLEVINRKDGSDFRQQDLDRLMALGSQAVVAIETARLHQQELIKQRMERELQLGQAMQSSLIPVTTPDVAGWDFAAWWVPAREVSGDFYDFIGLGNDQGVVVADVADKGVQSALFMSLTRSTVRASLNALPESAAAIDEANRLIAQDAKGGMFVTLCYARFQPDQGAVTYVNAGHNPPMWYRQSDASIVELEPTGIFLGFDASIPFESGAINCDPGDFIVFFTDGITEAMDGGAVQFGEERLEACLRRSNGRTAAGILEEIKRALADHMAGAVQSDDITVVVARRTGD